MLYLKKFIFNIFFYPLDRKLSIFYVGKDIFQRVPEMFFCEKQNAKEFLKMKMENFEKTTYIIGKLRKEYVENAYQTILLSTFQYHKHELEVARFGARAPRERQIMLFSSRVYDINMHFKKLCDKRFRRIFSSALQWCRWFFQNFPFSPSKSIKHTISRKVYF